MGEATPYFDLGTNADFATNEELDNRPFAASLSPAVSSAISGLTREINDLKRIVRKENKTQRLAQELALNLRESIRKFGDSERSVDHLRAARSIAFQLYKAYLSVEEPPLWPRQAARIIYYCLDSHGVENFSFEQLQIITNFSTELSTNHFISRSIVHSYFKLLIENGVETRGQEE